MFILCQSIGIKECARAEKGAQVSERQAARHATDQISSVGIWEAVRPSARVASVTVGEFLRVINI